MLGSVIRRRRRELGRTQDEIATHAGFSRAFLSKLERGVEMPGTHSLLCLARGLEMAPSALLDAAGLLDDPAPASALRESLVALFDALPYPDQREVYELAEVYQLRAHRRRTAAANKKRGDQALPAAA